ncbi:hypothetical protein SHKM778_02810 [Streptomyces sp. KM77-8]|uniref:Uncharacterized protein n=1 Tax=Streptomyces haneummycinicus TaxID=3074435 RepID=A0AAT9H934_9ACTN
MIDPGPQRKRDKGGNGQPQRIQQGDLERRRPQHPHGKKRKRPERHPAPISTNGIGPQNHPNPRTNTLTSSNNYRGNSGHLCRPTAGNRAAGAARVGAAAPRERG